MNIKTKSNFPKVQNLSYENEFYFYENKKEKYFQIKSFALGLSLKQRRGSIRE